MTIENGKDAAGKPVFQKILLVGEGKFGFQANGQPAFASAYANASADEKATAGKRIKVSGFLIYNDGKTAFQVESIEYQKIPSAQQLTTDNQQLGNAVLRGEITDPKCLLGVMNPGQGKPHRDCAVRCIAGESRQF